MPLCGKITKNLIVNCDNPSIGGVESVLYLFNRDDIAAFVRDVTNPQIVTDITLVAAAKGFKYEGINTSVKPRSEYVRKEYANRYNHFVDFLIFGRGSDVKKEIEALANGKYVAVIENLHKGGDAAFEILGTDVGLELKTLTHDPNDQNNEGAYLLQLGTPEAIKEPHMPATLFDTSYAATKAALLALIAA